MQTTKQLIDRAKKASGIESDYALSKVLEVSPSAVTNWRSGRSHPADELAAHLAQLAGQNPSSVLADLYAERAKSPAQRALWLRMADQLRHAVAAVMLCLGFAMLSTPWADQPLQRTVRPRYTAAPDENEPPDAMKNGRLVPSWRTTS